MASSSLYIMTSKPHQPTTQTIEIGDGRVVKVVSHQKGLAIAKRDVLDEDASKSEIRLDLKAVKILNKFMDDIRRAVDECVQNELKNEFRLPLGRRFFLHVTLKIGDVLPHILRSVGVFSIVVLNFDTIRKYIKIMIKFILFYISFYCCTSADVVNYIFHVIGIELC